MEDFKYILRRENIGTYPRFIGRLIRWGLKKFYLKRKEKVQVHLRGRGSRRKAFLKHGGYIARLNEDLPVKYAPRVAIYVTLKRS